MDYSRTDKFNKRRSARNNRTRIWLAVNTIVFVLVIVAIGALWVAKDKVGGGAGDGPAASGAESPTNSLPSASAPAEPAASEAPSPSAGTPPSGSGSPEPSPEPSESAAPSASEEPAASSPGADGEPAADATVSLALVGDILPAARVLTLMEKNGYEYPFLGAKFLLEAADITAGNLESAVTTRGTAADDKQFLFRAPPEVLPAIRDAGFDFLSLANNHSMDFGWEGLRDTMDHLDDNQIPFGGAGSDDREAFAPTYIERNGMTVAFVSVTRVLPEGSWKATKSTPGLAEVYDYTRGVAAIKEAKKNADLVVVMAHWGVERSETPVAHQTELAHRFVDAGADIVVGSHPHVLQGFESYKGKWIAYSLGNFVFTSTTAPITSTTGVLNATCGKTGDCELSFVPMFAVESQPAPMTAEKSAALLAKLSNMSINAAVKEDGSIVAVAVD